MTNIVSWFKNLKIGYKILIIIVIIILVSTVFLIAIIIVTIIVIVIMGKIKVNTSKKNIDKYGKILQKTKRKIIAKVIKKTGSIPRGFPHDVLIAIMASKLGATLFTINKKDFIRISQYLSVKTRYIDH